MKSPDRDAADERLQHWASVAAGMHPVESYSVFALRKYLADAASELATLRRRVAEMPGALSEKNETIDKLALLGETWRPRSIDELKAQRPDEITLYRHRYILLNVVRERLVNGLCAWQTLRDFDAVFNIAPLPPGRNEG